MSKYAPLLRYLRAQPREPRELSFGEIEGILRSALPRSAREHSAAWWSNERGTHVQARAWMDAEWKVWKVDRLKEKVQFHPDDQERRPPTPTTKTMVAIDLEALPFRAARLIRDYANENGGDVAAAISRAIEEAATARRNRLIDSIRANAPVVPSDSTDIIRAERDAR